MNKSFSLDIAKYIINKCNNLDRPINNLKVQAIMFIIHHRALVLLNKNIFDGEFVKYYPFPFIPSVYYEFSHMQSFPIIEDYDVDIYDKDLEDIINVAVYDYIDTPAWELFDIVNGKNRSISHQL